MSDDKRFSAWVVRDRESVPEPIQVMGAWDEPIEAIEAAEAFLSAYGTPGRAHAEIRFNGDPTAHTLLFLLTKDHIGIFNTEAVRWPVFYIQGMSQFQDMLYEPQWEVDYGQKEFQEQAEERETSQAEEQGSSMGEDQAPGENSSPGTGQAQHEDSEESDEEDDDQAEDEIPPEPGDRGEDDPEPMRLKFFAKMRGPKGWRKRAESDPERDRNTFVWRVGLLNEDGSEVLGPLLNIIFIERDTDRNTATLKITVPPDATMVEDGDFILRHGNKIEIHIPTQE